MFADQMKGIYVLSVNKEWQEQNTFKSMTLQID